MTPQPYRSPALVVAAALLLAGCGGAQLPATGATVPAPGAHATATPAGTPAVVTSGLNAPWSVAFVGDTMPVNGHEPGLVTAMADVLRPLLERRRG
jgi:glucose/arabinose dehydrogenase